VTARRSQGIGRSWGAALSTRASRNMNILSGWFLVSPPIPNV
jgi:hypothetical protein